MKSFLFACLFLFSGHVLADFGLIQKESPHSPAKTLNKLETVLKEKGIRIFARINHQANAEAAGLTLRPTELLIFGNPRLGTPIINSNQTAGIDLPMKVLAWQDQEGQTWLTYNDPEYIAERHFISNLEDVVTSMREVMDKLTDMAIAP